MRYGADGEGANSGKNERKYVMILSDYNDMCCTYVPVEIINIQYGSLLLFSVATLFSVN